MPNSAISDDSLLFIRVDSLCQGPAVTCAPELGVVEVARLMRDHDISGVVVVAGQTPLGVVSVREFRGLIADSKGLISGRRAGDIMLPGLVTIRRQSYVFEAIFKMAKHKIHRLIVLDEDDRLVGILTDTDILSLQTRTPLYLSQEIEAAQSIDQLRKVNGRILEMVNYAVLAGADTKSLIQLIAHFNDALTGRVIALLENLEGIRLPEGAAFLALGSEGRSEQTLRTDQDSAAIFRDDLPPEQVEELERFTVRLVDALETVGVRRCPGNTMASNPLWRHSLSEWKRLLDQWIGVPKPDHMVNFGMFQDLRILHGDPRLETELRDHIRSAVQQNSLFLPYVARNIVRFQPPLGWFGHIRVERRGEYRGKVDLKKAGIFALTLGVSLIALEGGIIGGSTWDKLERLGALGMLSPAERANIDEAFTFLVQLRLQRQLRALAVGHQPTNHVDPLAMNDKERAQFRQALRSVRTFLRLIHDRYQLDFISR